MRTEELVAALGGTKAMASLLGVSSPAVSNWKAADAVPAKHHHTLWRICQARGIAWEPPASEAA